jgi:2-polyprenyl-6-methoxyphenol hydroxylase-like FAD-dependent oxidoreductase
MTPLPETTDVVIVGAGPSGLAAALSIKARSAETTITVVDALPARENESRGLIINAQTLQVSFRCLAVNIGLFAEDFLY